MLVVNCADNGRVLLVEAASVSVTHEIPVGALAIGIADAQAVRSMVWVTIFSRLESAAWRWWPRFSPDGTH